MGWTYLGLALPGYGASRTALSLVPRWVRLPTGRRALAVAIIVSASALGACLNLNRLPPDSYRIASEPSHLLYYLALTALFFFAYWQSFFLRHSGFASRRARA